MMKVCSRIACCKQVYKYELYIPNPKDTPTQPYYSNDYKQTSARATSTTIH